MDTKTCKRGHTRPASVVQCDECKKERKKRYHEANRDKILAKRRQYRQDNLEKVRAQERASVDARGGNTAKMAAWRAKNPGKANEYVKKGVFALRQAAFDAYGRECACCGETVERFLTFDHVNNDGADHRRSVGQGAPMWRWMRDNEYPPVFQTMCGNCNIGRHINGGNCPHAHPVLEPVSYISGYRRRIKQEVVKHYGGECACCGQSELTFLTIDHVNNDGARHRQEIGGAHELRAWLKANRYPEGFQVLCFNCNDGRHFNGGTCPHEEM